MTAPRPLTARQPFKTFFTIGSVLFFLIVHLPSRAVYFALPANRQDRTWSWKQAIGVSTFKWFLSFASRAQIDTSAKLDPSADDPLKPLIPAIADVDSNKPILDSSIRPLDLNGKWYPAPFDSKDITRNTKVLLFMCGGAFVLQNNDPWNYAITLECLCSTLNAKCLLVGYRTQQPFPAQLQDLFSAYVYLLNLKCDSKNIILAGESAGCNPIVSFLRLVGQSKQIPLPCAALLSSPWIDLTPDPWLRTSDPKDKTDIIVPQILEWGRQSFVPSDRHTSDKLISPALAPFRSAVPIWIESGTGEVMHDGLERFAKDMRDAGTDTQFFPVPHGTHGHMWGGGLIGFDVVPSVDSFVAFVNDRCL